ncbi:addiction module antidote protein [Acidithiobacillus ferrivorans]|uniref:helix-turn-helix domain-containing transcriptional regulator n=1 Tax=Acidithiobacillus ferrivorans TaxID=160808 RepID=UPI0008939862|nr:addiction module antidote protein [Acidithiobacillus ferrivorans]MBU2767208.1 addiction module antidote protein [Acidithiobacillus ferrivorans]OFA16208.1 addiction module antidote protein [Acidithiobacillus ferrivorans]
MRDRLHDDAMADLFLREPSVAAELLDEILEDGYQAELMTALRQLTKAFGGVTAVAERANLNKTQAYRTLSADGNPTVASLRCILKAMGLRIAIKPIQTHNHAV